MIFATVGSMFPFDRFARALDDWAGKQVAAPEILVQIGTGEYQPEHIRSVRALTPAEFRDAIERCDLVVAHLGMGSIISAMQARKPIVLLPRSQALGEHTSDHQLDGTEWLRGRPGLWIADDVPALHRLLDDYAAGILAGQLDAVSDHASEELIGHVRSFVFTKPQR